MFVCPVCLEPRLISEDPLESDWVCLGEAVCGKTCYEIGYQLNAPSQLSLAFPYGGDP